MGQLAQSGQMVHFDHLFGAVGTVAPVGLVESVGVVGSVSSVGHMVWLGQLGQLL